jgi:hypothetical protein
MKRKRPKIIILLLIVFLWLFGKNLEHLLRFSVSPNYYLLAQIDLKILFFVFKLLLFILYGGTVWFLWKPKPIGFLVAISSLIVSFLEETTTFLIGINNIDAVRNATIIWRQVRGLPIREDLLNMIFTPSGMWISFSVVQCLNLLMAGLLFWKRNYFIYGIERKINPYNWKKHLEKE